MTKESQSGQRMYGFQNLEKLPNIDRNETFWNNFSFRSRKLCWTATLMATQTNWWLWWTNLRAGMTRPSLMCWTSMDVSPRPQSRTFKSSILIMVQCQLTQSLNDFHHVCPHIPLSPSSRWLHSDAVWPSRRGRLLYGLQFPHVCPPSFCHHSVILWWQTGMWMTNTSVANCKSIPDLQENKWFSNI